MSTTSRFAGKRIIITGAASGIGRATLVRLVSEGAIAVGVDLDAAGLEDSVRVALDSAAFGGAAHAVVASVADEAAVKRVVAEFTAAQGGLDAMINIAGVLESCPATDTTLELFRKLVDVNLVGTFLFCREALPHLLASKGNIVNTTSTSAQFGHPYMAAYAASKGGVYALTRTLAWEYLKQGVRVNAVMPGGILTPMVLAQGERMTGLDGSLFSHLFRPDGVFGDPAGVASVIAMLASADGANMTGEIVKVDGGVHN